ncbi:pyridoxamine 5'-phosphate oxidase family protein [Opitutus terrae]|uniref:Pyridoxamine 5'-phosphate oxidase-related FMN-binding n=1 Tax=Opitutus terrae (strain DSM 11246 / JCM 15787 / PB90-1) TaxID=452637 RepID=B1ZUK9_OPITP|nr:pyridoxamine 5'-phosphate oxidase family protein [Opitutus terrae]ACB74052.1 pyridoxamine 5'-phosphate oxidase-related FMN-binding [Opitutus terrae PB90-1]
MRREFLRTLATPTVQAAQARYYGTSRVPAPGPVTQSLGSEEQAFIAARDSFYLATVSENGWPYVQHRGGPKGFLRVVGPAQLAFADYNGNRQLLTTGNVQAHRRVALFLMDYAARERLKILGHARVLPATEAGEWIPQLAVPPRTVVERVFLIDVVGFDWNCPKYITPRFTAEEVTAMTAPLRERIAELERALAERRSAQGSVVAARLPET